MESSVISTEAEDHTDKILVERPTEHVALIRFNRLDKKNAFHSSMIIELGRVLAQLSADDMIRTVVLTGGEICFAAGADIKEMITFGPAKVANSPARVSAWQAIEQFEKPLIAAVNGMAFGAGCELALVCDFIVAGSNALFGQPEVKIGGMPGDGGSQRLPRKLPPNVAAYHLMTGDPIDAARALQFGLVIEIHDPAKTIARAVEIASAVAERAPTAVRSIKACIATAVGATADNGLSFERAAITALTDTEDSKEGMRAFVEKRAPNFVGR